MTAVAFLTYTVVVVSLVEVLTPSIFKPLIDGPVLQISPAFLPQHYYSRGANCADPRLHAAQ